MKTFKLSKSAADSIQKNKKLKFKPFAIQIGALPSKPRGER